MKTILVIEDDEAIAEVIALVLQETNNYTIIINTTGVLGRKIVNTPLDLIIVDYLLPHTTGAAVIQTLRKSPLHAHTPVILMSANTEIQLMRLAKQLRVADTLPKPFDIDVLVEKVHTLLT